MDLCICFHYKSGIVKTIVIIYYGNFTTGQEYGREVLVHILKVAADCQLGLQSSESLTVAEECILHCLHFQEGIFVTSGLDSVQ